MAFSKDSSIHFEKLTDENYATWKFKMEMLLVRENHHEVVFGTKPENPSEEWLRADRNARALICLSISDNQIVHVLHENSAKDTWNKLKSIHERTNLTSKLFLLRKLYSVKYNEAKSMQEHIKEVLQLSERLLSIGEQIKDSHLGAILLNSLPISYDILVTSLESREEKDLSLEYIKTKLIDEYERRKANRETKSINTQALKSSEKVHTGAQKQKKYCTFCHKNGHWKNECWHLLNKNSANSKFVNKHSKSLPKQQVLKQHNSSVCRQNLNRNIQSEQINSEEKIHHPHTSKINLEALRVSSKELNQTHIDNDWIIDSGATSHMTGNLNFFSKLEESTTETVTIANGNKLQCKGIGEGQTKLSLFNGDILLLKLENVLYVPELNSNLLSVKSVTNKGCKVQFIGDKCTISKENRVIATGILKENLYKLIAIKDLNESTRVAKNVNNAEAAVINKSAVQSCINKNCILKWHLRLGHRSIEALKQIERQNLVEGIELNNCKHSTECTVCIQTKLTESPYPKKAKYRAKEPLELIHTDVMGPLEVESLGGKRYILTFIDDFSRYTYVYLLKTKDEVSLKFKEYVASTTNKFRKKIKTIRSDNGSEYCNQELTNFLKEYGITHQTSVAYSPQQNGVAERKNRSLAEMTRAMLKNANLPKSFWGEAVSSAAYLQNRLPSKATNKTPYELWNNRKPNLSHIKVFGCKAFVYVNKSRRKKLDDRSTEGIFVGYDFKSKGYRIYTGNKNVTVSRSVKFLENFSGNKELETEQNEEINSPDDFFYNWNRNADEIPLQDEQLSSLDEEVEQEQAIQVPIRKSERSTRGIPAQRLTYNINHDVFSQNLCKNFQIEHMNNDPKSLSEIKELPKTQKEDWELAMQEEINTLKKNNTWELVTLPQGKKAIGSKWIFKTKYDRNGRKIKNKARLVAKGYDQRFGQDYDETFAPVVKHDTLRAFLAAATYKDMKVHHLDVKGAFLYGKLSEEIYMFQPEGFEEKGHEDKVCKLQKSIYGLKQAAKCWNQEIGENLIEQGFTQSHSDSCLFIKGEKANRIHVIVYVDDLLIGSKSEKEISSIITKLKESYEITDLGEVHYYLGIEISKEKNGNYFLSQKNKIEELVQKFQLQKAKPTNTPMETNYYQLQKEEDKLETNDKYRQAIGSLLYISTVTRPDIAASTHILSRRCETPRQKDWTAVKRIIRYLNTTKNFKLKMSSEQEAILKVYSDADWAQDQKDRKSTSGTVILLGTNCITWKSRKQSSVSLSSTEAEYIAVAQATQELLWLDNLMKDLDLPQQQPIKVLEDNQSTIKLSQSEKYHSRVKHIDIKYHHIRDLQSKGLIELDYCPTNAMVADIMTKPLPRPKFEFCRRHLNIVEFVESGGLLAQNQ